MKRPSKVTLGPHTHKIEWPAKIKKGKLGLTHRYRNRIEVSRDQPLTQQQSTVLHEIVHAIFCDGPATLFAGWSDETEEAIVLALESRLLEVFTRPENEPLRRWLES